MSRRRPAGRTADVLRRWPGGCALLALLLALLLPTPAWAMLIGVRQGQEPLSGVELPPQTAAQSPLLVVLPVPPGEEAANSVTAQQAAALAQKSVVVAVEPALGAGLKAEAEEEVQDWLRRVRESVALPGVQEVLLPLRQSADGDPAKDTFLFKRSSVAARAAAPAALVAAVLPQADPRGALEGLLSAELAAYVDLLVLELGRPGDPQVAELIDFATLNLPGKGLWLIYRPTGEEAPESAVLRALAAPAKAVILELPWPALPAETVWKRLGRLAAYLTSSLSPIPGGAARYRLDDEQGSALSGLTLVELSDATDDSTVLAYLGPPGKRGLANLTLPVRSLEWARFSDLGKNRESPISDLDHAQSSTPILINKLPWGPEPRFIHYKAARELLTVAEKQVVEADWTPPVEEIIRRYQEREEEQRLWLQTYRCLGQENWHVSLQGVGSAVDLLMKNRYFFEQGKPAEWERLEIYLNGVRWREKEFPDLPLIQPEKVTTLPFVITLSTTYRYELLGTEDVEGLKCYAVSFTPLNAAASLFSGTIWIDASTFRKVRIRLIQLNLTEPVILNEQTETYGLVEQDGRAFNVPLSTMGQQCFSVSGAHITVFKDIAFSDFGINQAGFAAEREEAHASEHTMIADTDQGLRYLKRQEDGSRTVRQDLATSVTSVMAGALVDSTEAYGRRAVPVAGANYLDLNFLGRNLQLNVFFAGLYLDATLADPKLGRTDWAASLELNASALPWRDLALDEDGVDKDSAVGVQPLGGSFSIERPVFKRGVLSLTYDFSYIDYSRDDWTADDFRIPHDSFRHTLKLGAEYTQWGILAGTYVAGSRREPWEAWGYPEDLKGAAPKHGYLNYGLSLARDFHLPNFQKINLRASGRFGSDLDRFAQHGFGLFNDRLHGYSIATLRGDRVWLGGVSYGLDLFGLATLEAIVDHAQVHNPVWGPGYRGFTGVGLAARFLIWRGTGVQLEYGYALNSVDSEIGGQTVTLALFKVF